MVGILCQPGIEQQSGAGVGFIINDPEFWKALDKGYLADTRRQAVVLHQAINPLLHQYFFKHTRLWALPEMKGVESFHVWDYNSLEIILVL